MRSNTTMLLTVLGFIACALAVAGGTPEPIQEPIPLTVWAPSDASNFGQMRPSDTKDIEEHTGYNIKWLPGAQENQFAELALLIVSGDAPDLLYSIPPPYYQELAKQGVLIPIAGELGPYQRTFGHIPDALWKAAETHGKVYGVPHYSATWLDGVPVIRSDSDDNGVHDLNTVERFVSFLQQQKAQNPHAIPMTGVGSGTWVEISPFCSYFNTCENYMFQNGKIVDTRVSSTTKEILSLLRRLVADGLLDPNYVNNDSETLSTIITERPPALISFDSPWQYKALLSDSGEIKGDFEYSPILPQSGTPPDEPFLTTPESFSAVTVASRHQTDAVRLMAEYFKRSDTYDSAYLPQHIVREIPSYKEKSVELDELTIRTFNGIISGEEPLDEFDDYVDRWRELGGERILEEANLWWSKEMD